MMVLLAFTASVVSYEIVHKVTTARSTSRDNWMLIITILSGIVIIYLYIRNLSLMYQVWDLDPEETGKREN